MTDLVTRVSLAAAVVTAGLAGPAAWLGGAPGAIGMVAGAALAIANLWWLSRRAPMSGEGPSTLAWGASIGLRLSAAALVVGALLVTGWAHPVGLVAGLSVLPPVLVLAGLRDAIARREIPS